MKIRGSLLLLLSTSLVIILAGCFKGEQTMDEMDPPQDAEAVDQSEGISEDETDDTEGVEEETESDSTETVGRDLYLIDVNGMVVSQTIELPTPESQEVAKQVLEHLVVEGPVTPLLPNGFRAVLPQGTEVLGLDLEDDGTMVVDLSEEFENYDAEDEVKILEAITHTLTQFENVDNIKLMINGHPLEEMPVDGTPMAEGYSKVNGINLVDSDILDLMNSEAVTMYYPAEHNDTRYYVPITKHIQADDENIFEKVVQTLMDGPGYNTNMIHVFNSDTVLTEEPKLDNGVLSLVFNQGILKDKEQAVIADDVMETLVRTLSEQGSVEAVDIQVEDVEELVNENGEVYNEPVSINEFIEVEKL